MLRRLRVLAQQIVVERDIVGVKEEVVVGISCGASLPQSQKTALISSSNRSAASIHNKVLQHFGCHGPANALSTLVCCVAATKAPKVPD